MLTPIRAAALLLAFGPISAIFAEDSALTLTLRYREQTSPESGRWLSPPLVQAMGETLGRGEQVLLFLNRRGYAPLVLC